MSNFIGSKSDFGFEYDIQSTHHDVMGRMRLWIEGKYIGAFDDVNIIFSLLYEFEGLEKTDIEGCDFLTKEDDEVFHLIVSDNVPDSRRYLFSPGEGFDDFTIFTYICNDIIYFLWKLESSPFFEYPHYPKGVQSAQVPVSKFCKTVAEFKKILQSIVEPE